MQGHRWELQQLQRYVRHDVPALSGDGSQATHQRPPCRPQVSHLPWSEVQPRLHSNIQSSFMDDGIQAAYQCLPNRPQVGTLPWSKLQPCLQSNTQWEKLQGRHTSCLL